jgi:glycerophosphoryl diester phosphodiesterase
MNYLLALAMVLSSSFTIAPVLAVEIVAHRGASHDAPENTVASFKLGWEQKADADELDIRLTKDNQIVVIHDPSTKRTTGVGMVVANQTLAELRALDAGSWKGPQWKGERLPTLSEALATIPDGKCMFIEIKCGPEVLPHLKTVLDASGKKPGQLVIIGFNLAVVQRAKQMLPRSPVFWLASYKEDKTTKKLPELGDLIKIAKAAGVDGLDLAANFPLDANSVLKVHAAGMQIHVWTVDDPARAAELAAAGVDGITTNRPAWLREQLQQRGTE